MWLFTLHTPFIATSMQWLKWILVLIGHTGIWCIVFNHIHASSFPRRQRKLTELLILFVVVVPVLLVAAKLLFDFSLQMAGFTLWLKWYFYTAMVFGFFLTTRWFFRRLTTHLPPTVTHTGTRRFNIQGRLSQPLLAGTKANILGRIPFNQALDLSEESFEFSKPNLHPDLDGLRIVHLSDLHFTGCILPEYFQVVIEQANRFEPDLVFLTGDLIDNERCLDWLESILSQLQAQHGKYYILGNHDRRIEDESVLRNKLRAAGLISAADGNWHDIPIGRALVRIAGNELPWYVHANELQPDAGMPNSDLKMLLSHTPDQIGWARQHQFDFVFAGHTHGGQIRLPLIGPIVSPSRHGVKYCAGTFQFGDTVMHVNRGLSADEPIRILCPPELTLVTIRKTDP